MALSYFVHPDDIVRHLMQQFWPGALTIIARCNNDDWYSPIRGGGDTVGLRMPDHPGTLEMIGRVGVPVLGPSANFHGKKTPYAFGELDPELIKLVDFVVPGVCKTGNVSTVIDTVAHPPKIIRQGAITIPPEMLV
jgi:L-threonylcarbamoyladenylate synthase